VTCSWRGEPSSCPLPGSQAAVLVISYRARRPGARQTARRGAAQPARRGGTPAGVPVSVRSPACRRDTHLSEAVEPPWQRANAHSRVPGTYRL
jgi:hypothetical protein